MIIGSRRAGKTSLMLRIDGTIREMLSSDKGIVERYKKNKNVINFIVGTISKKYGIQPRKAASRVREVINGL